MAARSSPAVDAEKGDEILVELEPDEVAGVNAASVYPFALPGVRVAKRCVEAGAVSGGPREHVGESPDQRGEGGGQCVGLAEDSRVRPSFEAGNISCRTQACCSASLSTVMASSWPTPVRAATPAKSANPSSFLYDVRDHVVKDHASCRSRLSLPVGGPLLTS